MRNLVVLHTNDLHGKLTKSAAEIIAEQKESADFYFDSGDCVKSGNVAIPLSQEPVWGLLALAGCDASVPGNREFHISRAGFRAKIAGRAHPVFAANLHWKDVPEEEDDESPIEENEEDDWALPGEADFLAYIEYLSELEERKEEMQQGFIFLDERAPLPSGKNFDGVGVFGIMLEMVTSRMAARHISAFINTSALEAADECVERLRKNCDTIICISHIGLKRDIQLAQSVTGIDVIFGGHSHDLVTEPLRVGETWVCQSGSHAKFVGRYEFASASLDAKFIPLR